MRVRIDYAPFDGSGRYTKRPKRFAEKILHINLYEYRDYIKEVWGLTKIGDKEP